MICGSTAGVCTRSCIAPLDVLKIRMQVQVESTTAWVGGGQAPRGYYQGLVGSMRTIIKDEGVTGLWRGNVPGSMHWLSYCGLQFATFSTVKGRLAASQQSPAGAAASSAGLPWWVSFVAGGSGGFVATVSTYPFDLLRTIWTAQGQPKTYPSLPALCRHLWASGGPLGFFRGLGPTLLQTIPQTATQFACYNVCKDMRMLDSQYPALNAAANGLVSGVVAKCVVQPVDVLRKRLQVNGMVRDARYGSQLHYDGWLHCLRSMMATEGVLGFYKGLGPNLLKIAPASGLTFAIYELAMDEMVGCV